MLRRTVSVIASVCPIQAFSTKPFSPFAVSTTMFARNRRTSKRPSGYSSRSRSSVAVVSTCTERTALLGPPSRTGAVDGQTDPAAIVEGLVALGATDEGEQGLPGGTGIEPLREITQRIVTEWSGDGECSSRRGTRQRLDRMKTGFPEDLSDQQGPEQSLRRNLGLLPTVSRILKIVSKLQTPHHKIPQATRRWTTHFFFFCCFSCFRARTKSFALAARTS